MNKGFCRPCTSSTTIVRVETNAGLVVYQLCPECDRFRCPHCKQTFGGFFDMTVHRACPLCKNVL